ncbi:MAG: hypothetical protein HQM10_07320 [Candidatus Riflebacteria bacterium]|nr:hypothetical protein [Candidatus Riflebacteria bacterium]
MKTSEIVNRNIRISGRFFFIVILFVCTMFSHASIISAQTIDFNEALTEEESAIANDDITPIELDYSSSKIKTVLHKTGLIIELTIKKVAQTLSMSSMGNFHAFVASSSFRPGYKKMDFVIVGYKVFSGKGLSKKAEKYLSQDFPLPPRKDFRGFVKYSPSLEPVDSKSSRLNFKLNLEVDIGEAIKTASLAGINLSISALTYYSADMFLQSIQLQPIQNLIKKLFPKCIKLVTGKATSSSVDEIIETGTISRERLLGNISIDEVLDFSIKLGISFACFIVTSATQGAVISSVAMATLPIPVIGNVAMGALLGVIVSRTAAISVNVGLKYLHSKYVIIKFKRINRCLKEGSVYYEDLLYWLRENIAKETKKDEYRTIHKLLQFLRIKPVEEQRKWREILLTIRPILEFQSIQESSWIASRYISLLDLIVSN